MFERRVSRPPSSWFVIAAAAAAASVLSALPRSGNAYEADRAHCYATAPLWNAKKGAIVSGVSPGPVAAVLGGVGETRTHTMISNGDWATHSTTLAPSIATIDVYVLGAKVGSTPDPDMPLKPKELAGGSPGFSQINMGGAYAYWSLASQVWTEVLPPDFIYAAAHPSICSDQCKAQGAADWLWSSIPFATSGSMYLLGYTNSSGSLVRYGYGFYQYMVGMARIIGIDGNHAPDRGIVCSQVAPYAYSKWVDAASPNIDPAILPPLYQTYSHADTINAGNALWWAVYNECMSTDPGYWGGLANAITSLYFGASIQDVTCNHAAWQILNCFFQGEPWNGGGCKNISAADWNFYVTPNGGNGARSLSPEGLMGINGKPATGPWANWTQTLLQWNGGGSTYGCYW